MRSFAAWGRRLAVSDPGVSGPEPAGERSGLPHRFEAVGEALTSGSDVIGVCSVEEALVLLRTTWQESVGADPSYDAVTALLAAWSDTTLGYLNQLSCEDPLTGLSSQAHLRSRLTELYRLGPPGAGSAGGVEEHALVVLAMPFGDDPTDEPVDHFTRAMRLARAGELSRTAFARDETVARLGLHRVGILTRRDERLGRRVRLLRTLLGGAGDAASVRVWIEGLPTTDAGAGVLLDELARG